MLGNIRKYSMQVNMTKRCCIQSASVQSSVFHRSYALSAPGSTTLSEIEDICLDASRFWCGRIRPTPQAKANPPSARSTAWCRPHEICCTSQTSSKKSSEKDLNASLDSSVTSFQKDIHRLRGLSQETLMLQNLPVSKYDSEMFLDSCCLASLAA